MEVILTVHVESYRSYYRGSSYSSRWSLQAILFGEMFLSVTGRLRQKTGDILNLKSNFLTYYPLFYLHL